MFVVLQFKVYSHFTVRSFRAVNCIFLILPSVLKKSLCKPSHNAYRRELHGDKYLSPFRPSPHLSSPSPLLFSTLSPSCNTHSHPQLSPQMIVAMPVPETIIAYQLKLKKNGKVKIHQHNKHFIRQHMVAQSPNPKQSNAMCRTVHISSLKINSSFKSMKEQQSIIRMWCDTSRLIT